MKYAAIGFASISLVSIIAFAQLKGADRSAFNDMWPQVGMPLPELEKSLAEIKSLLPAGPGQFGSGESTQTNVLNLSIINARTLRITAGVQWGPRSGRGRQLEFRKVDGKWKLAAELDWVS